jgi:Flp pilus assembly protein CpaB
MKQPTAALPRPAARPGNTVILVALILAVITVVLTNIFIQRRESAIDREAKTILVAARDLPAGHVLNPAKDLNQVRIPKQFESFAQGALDPETAPLYTKKKLLRSVRQNDPLRLIHFQSADELADQKIGEGRRGVPLPVNNRTAPGLLRPGMFIDIVATLPDATKKTAVPRTLTVMERVKIVAVGAETDDSAAGGKRVSYSSITVEVDPADAEPLIAVTKFVGKDGYDIVVRNPTETMTRFDRINPEARRLLGLDP